MKTKIPEILEQSRVCIGVLASDESYGLCGAFYIQGLRIIADDGKDREAEGWEHVSVSREDRTPTWEEMCFVKNLFWEDYECVIQLHPPSSKHINIHPNCLHLWKNTHQNVKLPPGVLV